MKTTHVQYQDIILAQVVLHFSWRITLHLSSSFMTALNLVKGRHMLSIVPEMPLPILLRFFHTELLEHYNYSVESCQDPVYALVEAHSLDRLLKMNYDTQVLQTGFFLQWDGTNCRDYQNSGGQSGVQSNEFMCICKDQTPT